MDFKLGEEQQKAFDLICEFLKSDKICFSLVGYAGTGKTAMIRYLINYLEEIRKSYTLCAPTHKAKVVLERFTNREASTLHKVLSLSPNLQIFDLDLRQLKFYELPSVGGFPVNAVIMCDESSMIGDDIYEMLNEKAIKYNCKIIFIGDKAQIKPVKSEFNSKVFDLPNGFELTQIFRQSSESGFTKVLPILRENIIPRFEDSIGSEGSIFCHNNAKEFLEKAIPIFHKAIKKSDILETKVLAYTNNRVNAFNKKIKETLFGNKEYSKFEFLTGAENLEFNGNKFYNSMDYVIIEEPVKIQKVIHGFATLPGYILTLYDEANDVSEDIFMLSNEIPDNYLTSLAYHIETVRLKAVDAKKYKSRSASQLWSEYYKIMGSFTSPVDLYYDNRLIRSKSFYPGYASTTHKSQGSSINNVFVDMDNILTCRDLAEVRQLQYVALSRARINAHILQK